jgi:8-amino-3,8-dideoxy-alpha-D-manno-octulosonate transaminase
LAIRKNPLPPMYPGGTAFGDEELKAVTEVIKAQSPFRFYGPKFLDKTGEFEKNFAKYIGTSYALAVSSGSAALHVALKALGVNEGDEVIVPAYAWVSCPAAVVACCAKPVIAEVDESLTLDPEDVSSKVTDKTKVIMAVHMRGAPANLDELSKIASEKNLLLLEDCAQAVGGSYRGRKLGSIGHIGTHSFQLNKNITAGEGGAITTNDNILYQRSIMIHDAGAIWRPVYKDILTEKPVPGYNYRITELQSAILIEQLKKLDKIIATMRKRWKEIKEGISDIKGIEFRKENDPDGDTCVCLVFFLENAIKAQKFVSRLQEEKIYTSSGGYPWLIYTMGKPDGHVYLHWQHYYDSPKDEKVAPKTLNLITRAIHLDISPLLTDYDVDTIIKGLHKVAKDVLA